MFDAANFTIYNPRIPAHFHGPTFIIDDRALRVWLENVLQATGSSHPDEEFERFKETKIQQTDTLYVSI